MSKQQRRAGAKSNAGASPASHLELGIAQFQAGRMADAEACFRQALEKFPTMPMRCTCLASLQSQRKDTRPASN